MIYDFFKYEVIYVRPKDEYILNAPWLFWLLLWFGFVNKDLAVVFPHPYKQCLVMSISEKHTLLHFCSSALLPMEALNYRVTICFSVWICEEDCMIVHLFVTLIRYTEISLTRFYSLVALLFIICSFCSNIIILKCITSVIYFCWTFIYVK